MKGDVIYKNLMSQTVAVKSQLNSLSQRKSQLIGERALF